MTAPSLEIPVKPPRYHPDDHLIRIGQASVGSRVEVFLASPGPPDSDSLEHQIRLITHPGSTSPPRSFIGQVVGQRTTGQPGNPCVEVELNASVPPPPRWWPGEQKTHPIRICLGGGTAVKILE